MRSLLLIGAILGILYQALAYPFAGVLLWEWFTLMQPQDESYSFARTLPLNMVIAGVTVAAWLFSRERKLPPNQFLVWVIAVFLLWMTFNSFFAYDPAWSWPYWDRTWKTFALGVLIAALATNRTRIDAILLIWVGSLFYYSVKGGMFTLLTGGVNHVLGPQKSQIADNNTLALGVLTTVPIAVYLYRQSSHPWIRRGMAAAIAVTVLGIIGTYSRGALVGLGALGFAWVLRSRRKILYLSMAAVGGIAIAFFMPKRFWERADTIQSIGAGGYDASFHGRVEAWQVAYKYAHDHFPFGAGFYGPQLSGIFNAYFPGEKTHAAHSIYFQVLGEHGFIGLFLYLVIVLCAFWKCSRIIKQTRQRHELEWAGDLARMLQMSLFVFCVVGAALSMAYYDDFVIMLALLVVLTEICAIPRSVHIATKQVVVQPPQSVTP